MSNYLVPTKSKASHTYKSLNAKQQRLLKLCYKFRFITAPLLQQYKAASSLSSVSKALKLLEQQAYLAKRYDKSYKLLGKAARYYLAPKGLRFLRDHYGLTAADIRPLYRHPFVSDNFIDHNLAVMQAYIRLSRSLDATFNLHTRSEVGRQDYFPVPAPDHLYLKRLTPSASPTNDYYLDIFTDQPLFILQKRFIQYLKHFNSGQWEAATGLVYPTILVVCPTAYLANKLQKYIQAKLQAAGIDKLDVYTTTANALLSSSNSAVVWTKINSLSKQPQLSDQLIV